MTDSQLYLLIGMAFLLGSLVITQSVWLLIGVSSAFILLHLSENL